MTPCGPTNKLPTPNVVCCGFLLYLLVLAVTSCSHWWSSIRMHRFTSRKLKHNTKNADVNASHMLVGFWVCAYMLWFTSMSCRCFSAAVRSSPYLPQEPPSDQLTSAWSYPTAHFGVQASLTKLQLPPPPSSVISIVWSLVHCSVLALSSFITP